MTNKKIYTGFQEDCSESQLSILTEFKNHISKDADENPNAYLDNWFQLRFCRSRNFKIKKIIIMFDEWLEWRKERDIDNILFHDIRDMVAIKNDQIHSIYFSIDNTGRPVKIDRRQHWDDFGVKQQIPIDTFSDIVAYEMEGLIKVILPYCSKIAGKRIEQTTVIMDMAGYSIKSVFDSGVREYANCIIKTAQDYFPEVLGQCIVVNAPFMVYAAYAQFKPFLSKATKAKVQIHRSDTHKVLQKFVNKDQQPDFLGGDVKDTFPKSIGPWVPYLKKCQDNKNWYLEKNLDCLQSDPYERAQYMDIKNQGECQNDEDFFEEDKNFLMVNDKPVTPKEGRSLSKLSEYSSLKEINSMVFDERCCAVIDKAHINKEFNRQSIPNSIVPLWSKSVQYRKCMKGSY